MVNPVVYKGKKYRHLKELSGTFGIEPKNLRARIQRGYSVDMRLSEE